MPIRKSALAGAAAVAIGANGLIGASTTPAAADDITNTNETARHLCESHYDGGAAAIGIDLDPTKKRSLSGRGANTDRHIGTLYVVKILEYSPDGDRVGREYCAVLIKGGATDGNFDDTYVNLWNDGGISKANGKRQQVVGPVYIDGDWDRAKGGVNRGTKEHPNWYDADIRP